MELLWKQLEGYELLDSGEGRKLERIAGILVDRPSPQAIWRKRLSQVEWDKASSVCLRTDDGGGKWKHKKGEPGETLLKWKPPFGKELQFKLRFTTFGHCGIFFEQEPIWRFLNTRANELQEKLGRPGKFINLFAYTGGASLSMAQTGAEVFHVDSAKGILNWAREWGTLNAIPEKNLRIIHEDARAFLKHSVKKGFKYDGILLDPPSWGHGKEKDVWNFNDELQSLIDDCQKVIHDQNAFILLTSHTHGVQHQALKNVLNASGKFNEVSVGELGVHHKNDGRILPAGIFACAER